MIVRMEIDVCCRKCGESLHAVQRGSEIQVTPHRCPEYEAEPEPTAKCRKATTRPKKR